MHIVYTTEDAKGGSEKHEWSMRLSRFCAGVVALLSGTSVGLNAQGAEPVKTISAVHMAALTAREGIVRVFVSSDVAAGDTTSGVMVAEPAGATPQVRETNLARLNAYTVEWLGQKTSV